ncbi:type III-B CRISPR-associated protein Cas10/Cmr2 [Sulfolobus tengchongensis]|uniref:Type III-B CRISPR-associated protein Cas10/Cmr2 n=1 Tax=Sulfolobus tengchongensis TaxID=207809 RepID=A0AAX4L2I4_9CREN
MNFKEKAMALLHDPPYKAFVVTGKIRENLCDDFNDISNLKAHEKHALCFAKEVLANTPLDPGDEILKLFDNVKEADHRASLVDRLNLPPETPLQSKIVLKNIINPKSYREIRGTIDLQRVRNEVAKPINNLLRLTNDEREAYHTLYIAYELLWLSKNLPLSPADTRIPTHTVFDHVYSTAMSYNIISKNPNNELYYIDVAGVQNFVSKARKLRDLWASSYLISLYAWLLVKDYVWEYGGDILIVPTARFNIFYYYSAINKFKNIQLRDNLTDIICKVIYANSNICDIKEFRYPRFPVVPATISIILPKGTKINEESIWAKIVDEAFNTNLLDDYQLDNKEIIKKIAKILPFFIRKGNLAFDNEPFGDVLKKARKMATQPFKITKTLTVDYKDGKYFINDIEIKTSPKNPKFGFDYCTMCGENPALVILPPEDDKYWENKDQVLLSPGEKLCPWCFTKRVFSINAHKAIPRLFGSSEETATMHFISVGDVASVSFKFKLDANYKDLEEIAKKYNLDKDEDPNIRMAIWKPYSTIIKNKKALITRESTSTYFNDINLRRELEGKLRGKYLTSSPHTYYSIIKGDGDNVGKILIGDLPFYNSLEEYLNDALNIDDATKKQNTINQIIGEDKRGDNNKLSRIVTPSYLSTVSSMLMRISIRDQLIIYDNYGFTIYTGGDDILAIAPNEIIELIDYNTKKVKEVLRYNPSINIVLKTRENYMGLPQSDHFDQYGLPLFPTSRSYAIYVIYYREPIYDAISSMNYLLDKAKESCWKLEDGREICKDTLIITDGDTEAYLPLERTELLHSLMQFLGDFKKEKKGLLSNSFIYDVISNEEILKRLKSDEYKKYVEFLIQRNLTSKDEGLVKAISLVFPIITRKVKVEKVEKIIDSEGKNNNCDKKEYYEIDDDTPFIVYLAKAYKIISR